MTSVRPLALFEAPLDRTVLIEASAGTGKTWTVTGLYLRLLLDAGLAVPEILVVTFTEAATEELRDRIRARLNAARAILASGAAGDDGFAAELLARYGGRPEPLQRLINALRSLDEAAIYTIHGFCQRALADSAFEGARPFDMELLADERSLVQEIVDDFWRRELHAASPLFAARLLDAKLGPEALAAAVYRHAGKPFLRIEAPAPAEPTAAEAAYVAAYERARALWRAQGGEVRALLVADGFNRNKYRLESLGRWLTQLDVALAPERAALVLFPELERFTPARLAEGMNRGFAAPVHPFFDACAALVEAQAALARAHEAAVAVLKARLLEEANRELAARKERRRVQSYNDLLLRLDQALAGEAGGALAKALRRRHRAALIDEFQDTDPVQLEIFRRLYEATGAPVFLVGDPKQAIYSFRGADVYAYLSAGRTAQAQYTLDTNWRSCPALVRAVNALFQRRARAFVLEGIAFHPARPAPAAPPALELPGDAAPLRLWYIGAGENGKPCTKERAGALAAQATAAEVARLLALGREGNARIGERALAGGDIAVLVRTHRQGRLIREALRALGIPSVQHAQDSVYASREALELERALLACAEPLREPLVRAALATEMLGAGAAELHSLEREPAAWEARRARFDDYHVLWRGRGFMHLFRELLSREAVIPRLLALGDGERRVTNLLHLGELLHQAAHDAGLGLSGLAQWLAEKRARPEGDDEAAQLRLESDAALVKIVTVHKSKGLQYPIVFCPFLWDGKLRARADEDVAYHDPRGGEQPAVHFGCPPDAPSREQAAREELAENLRLLYVALTRAEHRCYLVHGCINEAQTSPLAWLLCDDDDAAIAALESRMQALGDAGLYEALAALATAAPGDIALERLRVAPAAPWTGAGRALGALAARRLARPVESGWRITSFTALAAGRDAELPDYDAPLVPAPTAPRATTRDIHGFPRGTGAGQCLHAILEQVDFARPDAGAVARIVRRQLEAHGIGAEWADTVCDLVGRVRRTPLDRAGLRLADIDRARRLDELEFYYPLSRVDATGLKRLLERHGYGIEPFREQIESLSFAPVHGYMKGFIDLVFEAGGRYHLADYKSNWLGAGIDDYAAARLPVAIAEAGYHLQYLVYIVALHRYLGARLAGYDYDTHIGDVYYLFLRGMDPAAGPDFGIYRDRPRRALVMALDEYFRTGRLEEGR